VDFGVLLFVIVAAVIARAVIKAVNWANSSDAGSADRVAARRRRFQQIAERMRATAAQSGSDFPQPRAPIAPPPLPFTGQWPPPRPPADAGPPPPPTEPDVVVIAVDQQPDSAYSTAEPTDADLSADVTGDVIESAPAPPRRPYELSSSLDTTLSTSLTSSVIGEPGSVANGPQTVDLPPDLRQQVLDLMDQGYEVMAVRLVCDEMDVGILDAHKTVRTVAGLPTLI
jgi:hypothetical protein